ncbi:MAG: hypothetical protein J6Y02_01120 [Pseudobutyrivibrio sp.]|nr:hypothetical protein [Pseudobutyrivibrio sp.]
MKGQNIIFFLAGAAIGSVATWLVVKKKYDADIAERDESFCRKIKELKATNDEKKEEESAPEKEKNPESLKEKNNAMIDSLLEGVKKIQEEHKYTPYSDEEAKKKEDLGASEVKGSEDYRSKVDIEKIDWDIYNNEEDGFEKCGITKYEDNVFTDDADQVMSDGYLSETIGIDIKNEMIDSNMLDAVYVRNHKTRRDYEIICDLDTYEDAHNREE